MQGCVRDRSGKPEAWMDVGDGLEADSPAVAWDVWWTATPKIFYHRDAKTQRKC
jgi:hypothetical protein